MLIRRLSLCQIDARIKPILVVVGMVIGLAVSASPASADPTSPFYTGSASCTGGIIEVAGPTATSAIPDVVVEIQASNDLDAAGGLDLDGFDAVGPSDVAWVYRGSIAVGEDPVVLAGGYEGDAQCSSGSITASFFDAPSAPTSYSGATTYEPNYESGSELAYVVPTDDYYEAAVDVTQGAIHLEQDGGGVCTNGNGIFTATGVCDLGLQTTSDGIQVLDISALDGPQAKWTITIEPIPVALSAVSTSATSGLSGEPVKISYTVSGSTSITAQVYNSSDQPLDTLASGLAVAQGDHSLTWGATGANGAPLPAGTDMIELTSTDSQGNVSTQKVPFTITPVAVSNASATTSSAYVGGTANLSYQLNGTANVTATVTNPAGAVVDTLQTGTSEAKGKHSLTWHETRSNGSGAPAGRYSFSVQAKDAGGDVSTGEAAVTIKPVQLSRLRISNSRLSAGQTTQIDFHIDGPANLTGVLLSQSGKTIRKFSAGSARKAGSYYFNWRAVTSNGKALPKGLYRIRLTSIDAPGDRSTAITAIRVTAPG